MGTRSLDAFRVVGALLSTIARMAIIAHLGGIDEIGVLVVPVIVALFALRWVAKRAKAKEGEAPAEETEPV